MLPTSGGAYATLSEALALDAFRRGAAVYCGDHRNFDNKLELGQALGKSTV